MFYCSEAECASATQSNAAAARHVLAHPALAQQLQSVAAAARQRQRYPVCASSSTGLHVASAPHQVATCQG
jgi:hypothetical protein